MALDSDVLIRLSVECGLSIPASESTVPPSHEVSEMRTTIAASQAKIKSEHPDWVLTPPYEMDDLQVPAPVKYKSEDLKD